MLVRLGPFPGELEASVAEVEERELFVRELSGPATDEEALALLTLLGEDSLFGLAWPLVHMIESAPGWPFWDELSEAPDPWRTRLRQRLLNSGAVPPA